MPTRGIRLGAGRYGAIAVILIAAACGAVGQGSATPTSQPAAPEADPLEALNERFRAAYRHAKETELAREGPVILREGDNVVLRRGGRGRRSSTRRPSTTC